MTNSKSLNETHKKAFPSVHWMLPQMHLLPYWVLYSDCELLEEKIIAHAASFLWLTFSSMPGLPSYPLFHPYQWLWVCRVFIHVAPKIL